MSATTETTVAFTEIASGLRFPEGPIAMPDGSVLVVEIAAGRLTRIAADGARQVVAELGGGPNGAAMGPDGKCYVCNNGGFRWYERDGRILPGMQAENYSGGRIERVDLATGAVEVLYRDCDGMRLKAPNDIVFDRAGGFWFTDHGQTRKEERDRGALYYALADGSHITRIDFPLDAPNGVGLSPDESEVYVAETTTGRVWAYALAAPGKLADRPRTAMWRKGRLVTGLGGYILLDSLAMDAEGNICVATIPDGGITVIAPDGRLVDRVALPDPLTTNICFGGPDLRTAYITLSSTGRLVAMQWARPGLALNHLNR